MTDGNRAKRNKRIRVFLDEMISPLPDGSKIESRSMVMLLTRKDSRWNLDPHQIGNLIRERYDIKSTHEGWIKVST
jgi:hypothetical protein